MMPGGGAEGYSCLQRVAVYCFDDSKFSYLDQ